jgi:acetyl-CoA carboxylase alpha subunit
MKVRPVEFEKPIVELEKQLEELKKHSKLSSVDLDREVRAMEKKCRLLGIPPARSLSIT